MLQRDVADLAIQHDGVRHRRDPDVRAGESHRNGLSYSRAEELHGDLRSGRALERVRGLRRGPAVGVRRIDRNDAVALDHPRLFSGCVWEDALDGDEPLYFTDLHSDSAVTSTGLGIEGCQLLWREEEGVGVVQLVHQSSRRFLVKSRGIDAVYEAS